eukprot:Rhum_TRINITY_DN20833_c0_g1::Rhum_TRINITY_DN20833_c0_g1_i1::g.172348::m.172348/K12860/CDC5L, CDC5, CEF1; pre-mRNA-splicing factor CDC5/CEF1
MKFYRKGGVWKNHEDEVLKAAVMKYGKHQWARIASLLPKKTAKQSKERWNSWLDPRIKKTEWSKEEEEKLLYLAKIMPNRWRSIAPMVGRTPYQCLEHYNKLLDEALEKEGAYDPTNDPKKLRPGDVEQHPENMAPMPDGDDMSEDEKEMLNEARARIANTVGKKAKRKARGKQIEEARMLAGLQKRRELRAAGIDVSAKMRKKHGIDYATELPFFKAPPPGMFDTSEELKLRKQDDSHFENLDVQKAEGDMRCKKEAAARREDKKKQLKKKQDDLAGHFLDLNKKNDPSSVIKKAPLAMPSAQVSELDLRALEKLSGGAAQHAEAVRSARTERTPQAEDVVAQEALNQARIRAMDTPILEGGETPAIMHTSRRLATPAAAHATPNVYAAKAKDVAKEQRAKAKLAASGAAASLSNLPAPKKVVKVALRMTEEQKAGLADSDAAELEAAKSSAVRRIDATDAVAVKKVKRSGVLLSQVSQAVQRGLPRPPTLTGAKLAADASAADKLVAEEMRRLVAYDACVHPASGKAGKNKQQLDDFSLTQLTKAAGLVADEEAKLKANSAVFRKAEAAQADTADGRVRGGYEVADAEGLVTEMLMADDDYLFVPNPSRILSKRQASQADRLASLRHEFEIAQNKVARQAEQAGKLQKKCEMYTAGYVKRMGAVTDEINDKWESLQEAKVRLASYEEMWRLEELAIVGRTQAAKDMADEQARREAAMQAQYAALKSELARLQEQEVTKRKRKEAVKADADALAELEAELETDVPASKRARTE